MKLQKKIAMSAGGAVLVACVTLGGLATANAATLAPSAAKAAAVKVAAAKSAASAQKAEATTSAAAATSAAVPVPQSPGGAVQFPDWVKTLSTAQKQALLADLQSKLAKYGQLAQQGIAGASAAVEKLTYSLGVVEQALGQ